MTAERWQVGGRVGEWVLERALGQGGMGAVFVARHATSGAARALKLMTGRDARARERFAREGRALARIGRHPSIVGIDDVGETAAGDSFLVLELVEGASLEARLHEGPLPIGDALRVARDVARALACVHGHGIVHRDLKPGNVLLRPDGSAVLTDFGIARDDAEARLTASQALVGTPEFMAPEQIAPGRGSTVGPPADVFALGALTWTTLTGASPFVGDSFMEVVHRVTAAPIPRASDARAGVPADLDALVLWCLEREPGDRPDAATVAAALERVVAGEAMGLPAGRLRRRRGRAPRAALAAGVAGAVALALLAVDRALEGERSTAPVAPVAPVDARTSAETRALAGPAAAGRRLLQALQIEGPARVAAWREACAALKASPGDPALREVRARLEVLAMRPLLVVPVEARGRVWATPFDDDRALLTSPDALKGAWLVSLAHGARREVVRAPMVSTGPGAIGLSPEGRVALLAVPTRERRFAILRGRLPADAALADTPVQDADLLFEPADAVVCFAVSADGKTAAGGGGFPGLALLDLDLGAARWIETPRARARSRTRSLAFSPDGALLAAGGGDPRPGDERAGWIAVHALDRPGSTVVVDTTIVNAVRFGRRGGLLTCGPRMLYRVDPETGERLAAVGPMSPLPYGEGPIRDMDLAGDTAWTAGDALIMSWSWSGGRDLPVPLERRPRAGPEVTTIRATPDGALLLIGTAEPATLEVWGGPLP